MTTPYLDEESVSLQKNILWTSLFALTRDQIRRFLHDLIICHLIAKCIMDSLIAPSTEARHMDTQVGQSGRRRPSSSLLALPISHRASTPSGFLVQEHEQAPLKRILVLLLSSVPAANFV